MAEMKCPFCSFAVKYIYESPKSNEAADEMIAFHIGEEHPEKTEEEVQNAYLDEMDKIPHDFVALALKNDKKARAMKKEKNRDSSKVKKVKVTEKEVLEKLKKHPPLLNYPPATPYMVNTPHSMVGHIVEGEPSSLWRDEDDNANELRFGTFVPIEPCAEVTERQASSLISAEKYNDPPECSMIFIHLPKEPDSLEWRVQLTYPLSSVVFVDVPLLEVRRKILTVGSACWAIAQAYRHVYADPQAFGIWGHAMSDLCIELLIIEPVKQQISAFIGS